MIKEHIYLWFYMMVVIEGDKRLHVKVVLRIFFAFVENRMNSKCQRERLFKVFSEVFLL